MLLVVKMRTLERIGISFLLGSGIFTLAVFCYSTFGVKITTESTLFALTIGIIFIILLLKLFKRKVVINPIGFMKFFITFPLVDKIIVFAIASLMIGSLVVTLYFPVNAWDSIVLYDFRARIVAQQGFYAQIASNFSYFAGYPLFTSLSHTLVYIFNGNNPQFLYSLLYVSFIFIFYTNLRKFVDRRISLVASLMLATAPAIFDHSTVAYTNLPYTIFLVTGTTYLFNWIVKKKTFGYLILSAVLVGLSTWSRAAEPFWIINMLILLFLTLYRFKRYIFSTLVYTIFFFLIKTPWSLFNYSEPMKSKIPVTSVITAELSSYASTLSKTIFDPDRINQVMVYIYQNVITSWYPLIFLFLFCLFVSLKNIFTRASTIFLIIIFLHFALLLYGSYRFSFDFAEWINIPDSARRMAMFFIPFMIFYIGLSLGELKDKH